MSVPDRDVKAVLALHERLDRVRRDDRFTLDRNGAAVRHLTEALLWAAFHVRGMEHGEARRVEYNRLVRDWMGMTWGMISRSIIYADAPRYAPDDDHLATSCPVPMKAGPRKGEPCGKHGGTGGRETDPVTGQWRFVGYCRQHEAWARAAQIAEQQRTRAGGIPEPLPNAGGLLPCHVRGVSNWPDLYAQARYGWKPPRVGIVRDDWPTLARVVEKEPPRFSLVQGGAAKRAATGTDGTVLGVFVGDPDAQPPITLRLVGDEE